MCENYPAADLTDLAERQLFEKSRLERDFAEFERLRELVRPRVPRSARLAPGTGLGPLRGSTQGKPAAFAMEPADGIVLVRSDVLKQLQATGVRGLLGCRTELRSRRSDAPAYLELQMELEGLLHPDCLPPGRNTPCARCGRYDFRRPRQLLLDAASLPESRDVFRLIPLPNIVIASERLVREVLRLDLRGINFRELSLRPPGSHERCLG
jgi:uncharacterized double-CXXCG motif protein